jgi:hypothetical protein
LGVKGGVNDVGVESYQQPQIPGRKDAAGVRMQSLRTGLPPSSFTILPDYMEFGTAVGGCSYPTWLLPIYDFQKALSAAAMNYDVKYLICTSHSFGIPIF